jgi:hypothetical protein
MSGLLLGMFLSVFIMLSPSFHELFLLILVHSPTSVACLILPLFPCIW